MSYYSVKIDLKDEVITAQDVINNYNWIKSAMESSNIVIEKIIFNALFEVDKLGCKVETVEDFIHDTFQMNSFELNSCSIHAFNDGEIVCSFHIYTDKISVSAAKKTFLSEVVNHLNSVKSSFEEKTNTTIYNAPVINGNGNIVATDNASVINGNNNQSTSNSTTACKSESKKSAKGNFFTNMFNSIWGNIAWILLTSVVIAILVYFGLFNTGG